MPFALYFSWFYLRFLMQGEVVGEPGAHFALQTFFPEAYRPKIAELSDSVFQTVNESTGAFDYIQRKFKSPLQNTSGVDRKKYCSLNLKQTLEPLTALRWRSGVPSNNTIQLLQRSLMIQR